MGLHWGISPSPSSFNVFVSGEIRLRTTAGMTGGFPLNSSTTGHLGGEYTKTSDSKRF